VIVEKAQAVKAAGDKVTKAKSGGSYWSSREWRQRAVRNTRPKAKDQPRRVASQEVMRSGLAGKTSQHHVAKVAG